MSVSQGARNHRQEPSATAATLMALHTLIRSLLSEDRVSATAGCESYS